MPEAAGRAVQNDTHAETSHPHASLSPFPAPGCTVRGAGRAVCRTARADPPRRFAVQQQAHELQRGITWLHRQENIFKGVGPHPDHLFGGSLPRGSGLGSKGRRHGARRERQESSALFAPSQANRRPLASPRMRAHETHLSCPRPRWRALAAPPRARWWRGRGGGGPRARAAAKPLPQPSPRRISRQAPAPQEGAPPPRRRRAGRSVSTVGSAGTPAPPPWLGAVHARDARATDDEQRAAQQIGRWPQATANADMCASTRSSAVGTLWMCR